MLDRFLDALTGRRLGGALFVLGGLIVAGAVIWGTGGDDGDDEGKPAVQRARIVSVPELGLTFAYPRTWRSSTQGRVITLRSPDRSSILTFASPVQGRQRPAVRAALEEGLRERFKPAKIVSRRAGKLGQHPVTTFELRGVGPNKKAIRALALVGDTDYRTYAVTLITPSRPSAKRLDEARQIFRTVRFTVPQQRKRG